MDTNHYKDDMNQPILLCTDLDRTVLPNGAEPESQLARPLFRALSEAGLVCLVYVSGRDINLLQQAVAEYGIPVPDYAIGDVGSTIFKVEGAEWRPWLEWQDAIAPDWNGYQQADLKHLLTDIEILRLQEAEKQHEYKLSYYTAADIDRTSLLAIVGERLEQRGVKASLIWSIDEAAGLGLFDILPRSASKLGAIRFLMQKTGFTAQQTLFAGDSGNDLPVLVSELNSVLVRNAHADVRDEVLLSLVDNQRLSIYMAKGNFLGMNGNYAAGVLEGLAHFHPSANAWLEQAAASL